MRIGHIVVGVLAALAMGCGHELALTTGGTHVQRVERPQLPDSCRVVGDVSIGIPPDAAIARSEAELTILMRNKAADMGADHIVVERSEARPGAGGVTNYIGSASAYNCTVITGGGEDPPAPGGAAAGAGPATPADPP